jgi:hypothetical protein
MGRVAEDVSLFLCIRYRASENSRYDGLSEPVGERGVEESVALDEIGGPYLKASFR